MTIVAQRQEDTAALKKKIETAFKTNGVKLPKVNIVYPESGPSPHRGRQKLAKEYEQLTGEVHYLPEGETKLGNSVISNKGDGYRTIKRDSKTRVYSPSGKLIGVASSEKVADNIYRRHSGIRTNNIRK